jgi:hypothetical protein
MFNDTQQQEPKRQTPSEPGYYSDEEKDDSLDENDMTALQRESFASSSVMDTCATASIVEGHTNVRLPASLINITTMQPKTMGGIAVLPLTNRDSVKTTERYQKPFVRPQLNDAKKFMCQASQIKTEG